jgi:DNA-binding beta-propeller fold protein YncE
MRLLAAGIAALSLAGASLPIEQVARVPLPGPSVRFDYQSLDPASGRLWISHMDAGQLLVYDVAHRRVVKSIPASGVHGVIVVPSIHRAYASATNDHEAITIDTRTLRVLARAPAGSYPDGLAWDPVEHHVFVSDETGGVETVLSQSGRRIATIDLGGDAGNVQYDPGSKHVLVAVQSSNDVAVIDPRANRIVRRVAVPGCSGSHSLLIDAPRRVAFVTCEDNATLHVLDLRRMRFTAASTVGASPDVLAFDPKLRRLYVAAESGEVAVFAETAHGARKLGQAVLAPSAHTVAVDPRTHLVYFPLERGASGTPQLLIMRPR